MNKIKILNKEFEVGDMVEVVWSYRGSPNIYSLGYVTDPSKDATMIKYWTPVYGNTLLSISNNREDKTNNSKIIEYKDIKSIKKLVYAPEVSTDVKCDQCLFPIPKDEILRKRDENWCTECWDNRLDK